MDGTHYYYLVSSTNIRMLHEPCGWNMHSLKLTWPSKNGWKTSFLFGRPIFSYFLMLKGKQAIGKNTLDFQGGSDSISKQPCSQ